MVETGILTEAQREQISGEPERTQAERQLRQRVRKQIHNALVLDGPILNEELRDEDREKVFRTDKEMYGKASSTPGERTKKRVDAMELEEGIEHLIAFFYQGLENPGPMGGVGNFAIALHEAMTRVAMENGWGVEEFEFNVEFDKEVEHWRGRFESGEMDPTDALELFRRGYVSAEELIENGYWSEGDIIESGEDSG